LGVQKAVIVKSHYSRGNLEKKKERWFKKRPGGAMVKQKRLRMVCLWVLNLCQKMEEGYVVLS